MPEVQLNIPWYTPPRNEYYGPGGCRCEFCLDCLSKTLEEVETLDVAWYMHPPYDNYRCCVCGVQATGSKLHSTWALLCGGKPEDRVAVQYFRHALMPALNFWEHIYEGAHGSNQERKYNSDHFHTLMNEHLRNGCSYFQVCPYCRSNTKTVRQFLDKYESYEKARLEALEILERMENKHGA